MTDHAPMFQRDATPLSLPGGDAGALVLHGFNGTPGEMRALGRRLCERGITVEVPLLAGHGSGQEELAASTWRDWVSSADAALTALRARCDRLVLVGFSMGGDIALQLAARHTVAGIVTMSTPMTLGRHPLLPLLPVARYVVPYLYPLRGVDLSNPAVLERMRTFVPNLEVDPANAAAVAALRRDFKVSVVAIHQLARLLRQTRRVLSRVTAPALLMHARHDETVPISNVDILYRRLGSHEKRIVRFERSGHMLPVGPEREVVATLVTDFIASIAAR